MSDDLAQGILCLSFTAPAVAILLFALLKRDIGGNDIENSVPILEEHEAPVEPNRRSNLARRISAISIGLCLFLISALTVVTLMIAGNGTAGAGKCPLGF